MGKKNGGRLHIGLFSKLIRGSNIRQISVISALSLKQKLYFACFMLVHPAGTRVISQSHIHVGRLITSSGPGDTGGFSVHHHGCLCPVTDLQ